MDSKFEASGLFSGLRGVFSGLSSTLINRAELLQVEFQIERTRLVKIFLFLMISTLAGFLTVVALALILLWFLQENYALATLLALASICGITALVCGLKVAQILRRESFSGCVTELRKDQQCLEQTLSRPSNSGANCC